MVTALKEAQRRPRIGLRNERFRGTFGELEPQLQHKPTPRTTTTMPSKSRACANCAPRLGPSPPRPQLITHGPAHRGANGAAMQSDEDSQYGHFPFNRPKRERGARRKKLLVLSRSDPPHWEGDGGREVFSLNLKAGTRWACLPNGRWPAPMVGGGNKTARGVVRNARARTAELG